MSSLKYGLNHSFTDKSKSIKRDLAVEFESLTASVDELVTQEQKEEFTTHNRFIVSKCISY